MTWQPEDAIKQRKSDSLTLREKIVTRESTLHGHLNRGFVVAGSIESDIRLLCCTLLCIVLLSERDL